MRTKISSLCLLVFIGANLNALAGIPVDSLEQMRKMVYGQGITPHWIENSHKFVYQTTQADGEWYYVVEAKTGKKTRSKERPAVWSTHTATRPNLTEAAAGRDGVKRVVSPDKRWEAMVVGCNILVSKAGGAIGSATALTYDGVEGFGYDDEFFWSPDSRYLVTTKTRRPPVRRIPLIASRPEGQVQPVLKWRNYPKPGDMVDVSLPVLFDVSKMCAVPLPTQAYENQYWLTLTGWQADSRRFTFEFNQRGHQRYVVAAIEAETGAITHLIDERSETFIDYGGNFRFDTPDGSEIIWSSERDGWRHLYLIGTQRGEVKCQITKGNWVVRQVDYVDPESRTIYFFASGFNPNEDPYNMHYCSIRFDGTAFCDLTPQAANHRIYPSADRTYFVDVYSRPDLPAVSVLRRTSTGEVLKVIERCDVSQLQEQGWQMPEVFVAKGRDGVTDIWGTIYRPFNFDPSKSYPIIEDIYAGPHSSHVTKDFVAIEHYISSLAEQGFVVVKIDGMGTSNRSKAFHNVCWKNIKDAGFPDRILWIKAAADKYSYMDTTRVGVYGWSAGGQNAMGALLFFNHFYKAAVALCGCHDNRVDKMSWNERWMGYPVDESYSRSSNVDNAHLLKGKLLLINGELDENVDPTSSLQVVDALVRANKTFEQLYLPGRGHSLGGRYEMDRLRDFFVRNLLQ